MQRELVPTSLWTEMSDQEKIHAVVDDARSLKAGDRPSYEYLVSFIEDLGRAYAEETDLRKTLAKHALIHLVLVFVLAVPAVFGIIAMAKQLGLM